MALIICKDCGREISDMAAACPQCGRPKDAPSMPPTLPEIVPENAPPEPPVPVPKPEKPKKGCISKVFDFIVGIIALLVIGGFIVNFMGKSTTPKSSPSSPSNSIPKSTASQ